jgi:hypothetical protein
MSSVHHPAPVDGLAREGGPTGAASSDQDEDRQQANENRPFLQVIPHAVALFQLFAAQAIL